MEQIVLTHRIYCEVQAVEHSPERLIDFDINGKSSTLVAGSILMLLFVIVRIDTSRWYIRTTTRFLNILGLNGGPSEIHSTIFREQGVLIVDPQESAGRSDSSWPLYVVDKFDTNVLVHFVISLRFYKARSLSSQRF